MRSDNKILLIENNLGTINKTNIDNIYKKADINTTTDILKNYINLYDYIRQNINRYTLIIDHLEKAFIENLNRIYQNIDHHNIFIGGDHSTAIATISKIYKPGLKIIWIDAHPDINTYNESISKNYHGMPLAYLSGIDSFFKDPHLNCNIPLHDIMYIGIRSIDYYERKIIEENNISWISCDEINNQNCLETYMKNYKDRIEEFIGESPIHISFDVDCLDPLDMPCTGTTENNGIYKSRMKEILDYLLRFNINSLDIVELNLGLGDKIQQEKSLATLFEIFENYKIFNK